MKEREKESGLKQKDVPRLVAFIIVTVLFAFAFYLGSQLHLFGSSPTGVMWSTLVVIFLLILVTIWMFAALATVKSLFVVAAELSLLIFLAQSYCAVPNRTAASNEALKALLIIGLIYIAATFLRSLFKTLKENYKVMEKDKWSWEKIFTVSFYLIFTAMFIWEICLVITPIVQNLCV